MTTLKTAPLENAPISVRVRLASMWAVIMFFYIYNDVFMLLKDVQSNSAHSASPPSGVAMLAYALVITPAALMPLLCVVVTSAVIRWVNIVLGVVYFLVIILTLTPADTPMFYRFIGVVENIVTLIVVGTAWRWPRTILL